MLLKNRSRPKQSAFTAPDVAPQTDLDSLLREFLCRFVEERGSITIDMTRSRIPGKLRWEFGARPSGETEVTIWFVPDADVIS